MGLDIRTDASIPAANYVGTGYGDAAKVPGVNTSPAPTETAAETSVRAVDKAVKSEPVEKSISLYETLQQKKSLETDLNNIIRQIMPERSISFSIHESTGEIITKVIDNTTKDIVREFPAEKILDMIHNMMSRAGIIVNKKA